MPLPLIFRGAYSQHLPALTTYFTFFPAYVSSDFTFLSLFCMHYVFGSGYPNSERHVSSSASPLNTYVHKYNGLDVERSGVVPLHGEAMKTYDFSAALG